ncbi:MAG: hypothetical protein ACPG4I_07950 [Candidatus Puniceispirillaceae bacterium]
MDNIGAAVHATQDSAGKTKWKEGGGITDLMTLEVRDKSLILTAAKPQHNPVPRQGWAEAASALAAQDAPLLIEDIFDAEDLDGQIDNPLSDIADLPG